MHQPVRRRACSTGVSRNSMNGGALELDRRSRSRASAAACRCAGRTARRPSASCRCTASARRTSRCSTRAAPWLRCGSRAACSPFDRARRRTGRAPCAAARPRGVNGWIACSTFACSSRTASASNEIGGSIAVSVSSWNMWFGHHVAQRARLVVVAAAPLDADRLGDGDLHVVDVAAVPDRLEDAVAEAERQDVLDGLLARGSDRCGRSASRRAPPAGRG